MPSIYTFPLIFLSFVMVLLPNTENYAHALDNLENNGPSIESGNKTNYEETKGNYGSEPSQVFVLDGEEDSMNSQKPVLRKCCRFGEKLTKTGCETLKNGDIPFHPVIYHTVQYVINESIPLEDIFKFEFGDTCLYGRYRLEPEVEPMDEFYLLDNGSLWLPAIPVMLMGTKEFCMEAFFKEEEGNGEAVVLPLVCFLQPDENEANGNELSWILYPIGLLLSVPFLLLTLFTHILIPELHSSIQGKCFMCHVISLTFAYLGLASIQLSKSNLPTNVCVTIAFAVQFAFVACFAWLNVMCFDIWRRIKLASSPSTYIEIRSKSAKRKIFMWYSFYAWSCPFFIIIVSMVMDLTPSIPASYIKPQFGVASCWFLTNDAALPYFYGPIGVMILANAVLFVLTAKRIISDHKIDPINSRSSQNVHINTLRNHNKTIKLCFTLFVLMGVNWTMEIISWATGSHGGKILKHVWYFTDVCNSLQGVFIFVIFMLDSRVRFLLKRKFKNCMYSEEIEPDTPDTIAMDSVLLPEPNSKR